MAFPFGALVPGLTRALTSYGGGQMYGQRQAQQDALAQQDRERQARQDLLSQQLINAQLGNYQSLAQERQQNLAAGQQQAQQIANAARAIRAQSGIDPRLAALPDAELVGAVKTQVTQAPRNIDPNSPEAIQARLNAAKSLSSYNAGLRQQGGGGTGNLNTPMKKAAIQRLAQLTAQAKQLEAGSADVANVPILASAAPALGEVPQAGGMLKGLVGRVSESAFNQQQQVYRRIAREWTATYLQIVPSATRAMAMQSLINSTFFPPAGTHPLDDPSYGQARESAVNGFIQAASGRPVDLTSYPGFDQPETPTPQGYSPDNPFLQYVTNGP